MIATSFARPDSPNQRLLLAGAVGIAVAAGTLAASGRLPLPIIVAPVAVVIALAAIRKIEFGLAILPVVGAAVPFHVATGSQSPIVAALALAMIVIGLSIPRALRANDWSIATSVVLPIVALVLVWILAYLWGNVELDPLVTVWSSFPVAQLGGTAIAIVSFSVLLVAMSVGRSGPWIAVATWGLIACGAVVLVPLLIDRSSPILTPFETGGLFTMWVVALSFGQALFNSRLHVLLRIALAALALGWEIKAAVLETWWFSGWLPTLVVLVVILFLRSRVLFGTCVALGGVAAALNFDRLYGVVWGTTVQKGDLSRLDIWQQTFDLQKQHLLLGTGPAGYAVYFQSLYAGSPFSMSTHNNYLDVLAETGIIGAIVFAWFLVTLLVLGWRARRRWGAGFHGAFAQSAFAGLIGVIVAMSQGDWFIPFVYNQTIAGFRYTVHSWVFLGFLMALALTRPIPQEPPQHD